MPERLTSSGHEEFEEEKQGEQRYPSEQELQDFEARQEVERLTFMSPAGYPFTVESFARDPEHPTEDELRAIEDLNRTFGPHIITFEEYFGYPDPREPQRDPEAEQSSDNSQQ
jgi:hypothetical protein